MKAAAIASVIATRPVKPSPYALISEFHCGYQQAKGALEMVAPSQRHFQPLFDLMSREHGLTLLESEREEIERVCRALGNK